MKWFFALVVVFAPSMSVADYKGQSEIGGFAGGFFFENDSAFDEDAIYGGRLGHYFRDWLSAEIYVGGGESEVKNTPKNADFLLKAVEAQFHCGDGRLRPFLAIGAGALDINRPNGRDLTDFVIPYGAGVKWGLAKNLLARVDARHVIDLDIGKGTHDLLLTAGVSLLFPGVEGGRTAKKTPEPAAIPAPVQEAKAKPVIEEPKKQALAPEIKALRENKEVKIDLEVQFDTAKATIKPQYEPEIKRVIDFLKTYPNVSAVIEGHTDSSGSRDYNVYLSQQRADSVKDYIINKGGILASRISAIGYGPDQPRADNNTAEGRAQNRRVVATLKATEEQKF